MKCICIREFKTLINDVKFVKDVYYDVKFVPKGIMYKHSYYEVYYNPWNSLNSFAFGEGNFFDYFKLIRDINLSKLLD